MAHPVYDQLVDHTPDGFYLVTDTAFLRGTAHVDKKLNAPLKQGNVLPRSLLHRTEHLALDCQLLSYWQTAEWGMRALQGGFGHLRAPLTVDADARLILLHVVTCAYNLQTRCVGLNKIWAVYCDIWLLKAQ